MQAHSLQTIPDVKEDAHHFNFLATIYIYIYIKEKRRENTAAKCVSNPNEEKAHKNPCTPTSIEKSKILLPSTLIRLMFTYIYIYKQYIIII